MARTSSGVKLALSDWMGIFRILYRRRNFLSYKPVERSQAPLELVKPAFFFEYGVNCDKRLKSRGGNILEKSSPVMWLENLWYPIWISIFCKDLKVVVLVGTWAVSNIVSAPSSLKAQFRSKYWSAVKYVLRPGNFQPLKSRGNQAVLHWTSIAAGASYFCSSNVAKHTVVRTREEALDFSPRYRAMPQLLGNIFKPRTYVVKDKLGGQNGWSGGLDALEYDTEHFWTKAAIGATYSI
ncbi:hypothetical protein BT69DRAFT_1301154 [Atractiella rhizophila]|nr:hypothetical protein BT69DRAFT_1301154 [Atractiella rhizophila]